MSTTQEIRRIAIDHHDAMAPEFEAFYAALEGSRFSNAFTYGRAKLDAMVDALFASLPKGAAILDVGCGTGEHLKRALSHGLVAVGLEPAEAMRQAAIRNVPEARIEAGVATELPFADGEFDALLMIEVLRYLHQEDIDQALREARRVLKPGGVVFVTLVNRWALDGFYLHQRLRQLRKRKDCDEVNPFCVFFSPKQAEQALRRAGFVACRTEGRMLAPLRIAYKVNEGLGRRLGRMVDRLDDRIHRSRWPRRFAGHLVAIGRVPE